MRLRLRVSLPCLRPDIYSSILKLHTSLRRYEDKTKGVIIRVISIGRLTIQWFSISSMRGPEILSSRQGYQEERFNCMSTWYWTWSWITISRQIWYGFSCSVERSIYCSSDYARSYMKLSSLLFDPLYAYGTSCQIRQCPRHLSPEASSKVLPRTLHLGLGASRPRVSWGSLPLRTELRLLRSDSEDSLHPIESYTVQRVVSEHCEVEGLVEAVFL